MNELITKVFVEQPLASPGSAKNLRSFIIYLFENNTQSSVLNIYEYKLVGEVNITNIGILL